MMVGGGELEMSALYDAFRAGEWLPMAAVESDTALRAKVREHRVVYSTARDAVVINEPFSCERL